MPDVFVTRTNSNKYELFERLLSFIDTPDEINAVLCGYFCKVFAQLLTNKAKEVYSYVYSHTEVLDNLVRHSYQKSISEILIKLLNTTDNLFYNDKVNLADINSIRASFIFKIVQKLSPNAPGGLEDHLNAGQILSELAEYKTLQDVLVSERCYEEYVKYLMSDCSTSK